MIHVAWLKIILICSTLTKYSVCFLLSSLVRNLHIKLVRHFERFLWIALFISLFNLLECPDSFSFFGDGVTVGVTVLTLRSRWSSSSCLETVFLAVSSSDFNLEQSDRAPLATKLAGTTCVSYALLSVASPSNVKSTVSRSSCLWSSLSLSFSGK